MLKEICAECEIYYAGEKVELNVTDIWLPTKNDWEDIKKEITLLRQ